MRKFIIDTDTGSDDAAAIMLAIAEPDIEILGLTTVSGNIPLEQATKNALQTLEISKAEIPVYPGCSRPMFRQPVTAQGVHGKDGMGDQGLIHPTTAPQDKHAVDFIIETARKYPGELEIVALGPATNIALALMKDREAMKGVKRIWSMGTAGFGAGNCSPVAEFNVYVDAESYAMMLESGIPITIIGFDLCLGPAALYKEDLDRMANGSEMSKLVVNCTKALLSYNLAHRGLHNIDLPDAVAMGVALWDDLVTEDVTAYCYCCTREEPAYGQVIIYDANAAYSVDYKIPDANAVVIKSIDHRLFKKRLIENLIACR
jgi:purine nucleosidase